MAGVSILWKMNSPVSNMRSVVKHNTPAITIMLTLVAGYCDVPHMSAG
jgi:hypothetical protein